MAKDFAPRAVATIKLRCDEFGPNVKDVWIDQTTSGTGRLSIKWVDLDVYPARERLDPRGDSASFARDGKTGDTIV